MSVFLDIVRNTGGLLTPRIIFDLSEEQLNDLANGCGPAGARVDLVPDAFLGCDFAAACLIHDACYHFGEDEEDKRVSDRLFLYNLLVSVDAHCRANGILNRLERVALRKSAWTYYLAVSNWGNDAFWAGKVPSEIQPLAASGGNAN